MGRTSFLVRTTAGLDFATTVRSSVPLRVPFDAGVLPRLKKSPTLTVNSLQQCSRDH